MSENQEAQGQANQFRLAGNEDVKAQRYEEALKKYTQALELHRTAEAYRFAQPPESMSHSLTVTEA